MYGNAGKQYDHNFRVIKKGDNWHWMNTATGFVSNKGYATYDEADAAAKGLAEDAQAKIKQQLKGQGKA